MSSAAFLAATTKYLAAESQSRALIRSQFRRTWSQVCWAASSARVGSLRTFSATA